MFSLNRTFAEGTNARQNKLKRVLFGFVLAKSYLSRRYLRSEMKIKTSFHFAFHSLIRTFQEGTIARQNKLKQVLFCIVLAYSYLCPHEYD